MPRIRESDLYLPALWCIDQRGEISTTQLQACLRAILRPSGEDLELLSGRPDDKFSQKVRNLKSHEVMIERGWVTYEVRGNNGYWTLTEDGRAVLDRHRELLDGVLTTGFPYQEQQQVFDEAQRQEDVERERRRPLVFDENEVVVEGPAEITETRRRARSARLRKAAVDHFTTKGSLCCAVCSFDFEGAYGERGAGYIEIHHRKPIYTYEQEDEEQTIREALENLVPVCANCHRMLHRRRDDVWTVERLKEVAST